MSSLNKVCLLGNVGKEPEIRSMQDGREVANFSIATSDSWKDKNTGEKKEKTEWHNIVVFSPGLVNLAKQYITKGTKVYLEGALQTSKYTDKNGVEKYQTSVVLNGFNASIILLGSNEKTSNAGASQSYSNGHDSSSYGAPQEAELNDDIPF